MSKVQLIKAIEAANKRYFDGRNDDDQVKRMIEISKNTKGYTFRPLYDSYEICTDLERLTEIASKYGYWSDEVREFNSVLLIKGGYEHMNELNNQYKEISRNEGTFKKYVNH